MRRWVVILGAALAMLAAACGEKSAAKKPDEGPIVLPAGDPRLEIEGLKVWGDGTVEFAGCATLKRVDPQRVATLARSIEEGPIFHPGSARKPPDCPNSPVLPLTIVIGGVKKTATFKMCEGFSHVREAAKAVVAVAGDNPCS